MKISIDSAYLDAYQECNPGDKPFMSPHPNRLTSMSMEIYAEQYKKLLREVLKGNIEVEKIKEVL